MLIVRVLFGMAEGPVSAAGNKIINNWISRKESATAIGIFSAGSRSAARCRADCGPVGVILRLAPRIWHYFLIWPGLGTTVVLYR